MSKVDAGVKRNPALFNLLMQERKTILLSPILLKKPSGNGRSLTASVPAVIAKQKKLGIVFMSSKHRYLSKKYSLQLRCESLTPTPYIRLDSDGPSHRNKQPNVPIHKQNITTPHFNTFDVNGYAIAYKTKALENKKQKEALIGDINVGAVHFCKIVKMRLNDKDFPILQVHSPELAFSDKSDDPNSMVNFKI